MIGFYFTLIDSPIEQSKFEQWYGLYKQPMLSIAYDILHDYQEAEDAVHESFIKIAKHIGEIDDSNEKRLFSFIYTTTKHVAIDMHRKRFRNDDFLFDYSPDFIASDALIDQLCENADIDSLVKCLQEIPPYYAEILYYHYAEEYTMKQLSHMFHRPVSTVKKQLVRGKKLLIEKLQKKGVRNEYDEFQEHIKTSAD